MIVYGQREIAPHEFDTSLQRSHAAEDLPLWEECYRQFFPDMASMTNHRKNGEHQQVGIDRSVTLDNAKQILIDEKVRYPNPKTGQVYDDIALEYLSDRERKVPGWVCKPLRCDYIAYAILGLGKCYLLPTIQLQLAWKKHAESWKETHFFVESKNKGRSGIYWSESIAVPEVILYDAIGSFLKCNFTK